MTQPAPLVHLRHPAQGGWQLSRLAVTPEQARQLTSREAIVSSPPWQHGQLIADGIRLTLEEAWAISAGHDPLNVLLPRYPRYRARALSLREMMAL